MSLVAAEQIAAPPKAHAAPRFSILRRSLKYGRMRIGLGLTGLIVAVILVGPLVAPHSPSASLAAPYASPSSALPLGADYLGEDVLSRVLWGGRTLLWVALVASVFGVGVGVLLGLVAGYSRTWLDEVLMRPLDVILAFPQTVFVLLFVSLLGPKIWLIALLVGVLWIPTSARQTRSLALEVASRDFIQAVEALGVPRRRILIGEILPNIATPLLVEFGLRLTWSIGVVATLSFLGYGIQPPAADWGLMVNQNREALATQPWGIVAPVLCIGVLTVGTNLMAEGLSRAIAGVDREAATT